jgi:hypothetical protein
VFCAPDKHHPVYGRLAKKFVTVHRVTLGLRAHQPVESRVSGVRLEHHEPDGPRDARADEKPVDVQQVMADEQRRTPNRHVVFAADADPVEGVRVNAENATRARKSSSTILGTNGVAGKGYGANESARPAVRAA